MRPVVLKFVFGKGLQKRRRESDDTARFIAEQVTIEYANSTAGEGLKLLQDSIERNVRAELEYIHKMFFKYVIGAPRTQRKLRGTLTARAKSSEGRPSLNLGSLNLRWAPRSERYLNRKVLDGSSKKWFAYKGGLAEAFLPTPGAGGITLFEEIFGPVTVTIRRNLKKWGLAKGNMSSGVMTQSGGSTRGSSTIMPSQRQMGQNTNTKPEDVKMMLGTISVRALGSLNPGAVSRESLYGAGGAVRAWDDEAATKLAGRKATYRPALEPFLDFFLERSLAHAASERLRRGVLTSSLSRARR